MILYIKGATISEGFEAFLRINNSGSTISQSDLMLAAIGCTWSEAREAVEALESKLKPDESKPYFSEPNADLYRSLIIQGSLIVGTGGQYVQPEI